jgi:hypothetical protein
LIQINGKSQLVTDDAYRDLLQKRLGVRSKFSKYLSEDATMTRYLPYITPIALVGLMASAAPAAAAVAGGSMAPDVVITAAEGIDAPLVLVRGGRGGGGRGGGGGYRGGGGGGYRGGGGFSGSSFAGAGRAGAGYAGRGTWGGSRGNINRGNFNTANISRNVNVGGGGYYGGGYRPGWGGVAAGVAAGAVVGAAATGGYGYYSAPAYSSSYYCPYPDYPNCGL